MIRALIRKASSVAADPALRLWLIRRALCLEPGPPDFIAHQPPYLTETDLSLGAAPRLWPFREIGAGGPTTPLSICLPGQALVLEPAETTPLFGPWADLETLLSVHRFAWLPLAGSDTEPGWVASIWSAWCEKFGKSDGGWAWHPYTAAERAINLLDYARHQGLPPECADLLPAHAAAIASSLEYFGPHYTGNHLANNGRGLYLLGLALGWDRCAALGRKILLAEADRIFARSGILNEQSSHYHLLLTRNYLSVWLAAARHDRPEQDAFRKIAERALRVLPCLHLTGGLPLIGDISPDCPPGFLACLLPGGDLTRGWGALLLPDERDAVEDLRCQGSGAEPEALCADGWLKGAWFDWEGLWHASPLGWPAMPGHAHQDLGSAELHWRGMPLFIDPGRGAYGESGQAAFYRSASVHNLLQVDGADPYPANRPYYSDVFRKRLGGACPRLQVGPYGVTLEHHGFRAQEISQARRQWHFTSGGLEIRDELEGSGQHDIMRRFVTPWPVFPAGEDGVDIVTPQGKIRLMADGPLKIAPLVRWLAYGTGEQAHEIVVSTTSRVPWQGQVVVRQA